MKALVESFLLERLFVAKVPFWDADRRTCEWAVS